MKNLKQTKQSVVKTDKLSGTVKWNKSANVYLSLKDIGVFSRVLLLLLTDWSTKEAAYQLIKRIRLLWKKNGSTFTVTYLKEAHRLLMKTLAGQPEKPEGIRVAIRRGLPLIIPGSLRLRIESKDVEVIRLVLTILTIYRIMRCEPKLKLETITGPFTGLSTTLHLPEILKALRMLDYKSVQLSQNAKLLDTVKAGPNHPIAIQGSIIDAYAFNQFYPELLKDLETVCKKTGMEVYHLLLRDIDYLPAWLVRLKSAGGHCLKVIEKLPDAMLGRLSKKFEPAGKVRVFAITDIWSQSALSPLNDYLFKILRLIPQDGTFDQMAPLLKLKEKGCQSLYSFDLSAATDRLPMDLQVQVMTLLQGESFALAWRNLLVNRAWVLDGIPYKYSVGQPMGALSSWASLALTHHIIIQIAAMRSGWNMWFDLYAVLGDDVVIADKAVATNYLAIMSDLGVSVNPSKSLESHIGLAEFAKRLIGDYGDVSPVPPKLILRTSVNPLNLVSLIRDYVGRGGLKRPMDLKRFIESVPGSKKLPKDFIWNISGPLGFLDLLGLSPFLGNKSLSQEQLQSVAKATDRVVNRHLITNHYRSIEQSQNYWSDLMRDFVSPRMFLPNTIYKWSEKTFGVKAERKIRKFVPSSPLHAPFHFIPSLQAVIARQDKIIAKMVAVKPSLRDHSILLAPLGYTYETVYQYMVESFLCVDGINLPVANILEKSDVTESFSSRLLIYKELEHALEEDGLFQVLQIRHLPDLKEGI